MLRLVHTSLMINREVKSLEENCVSLEELTVDDVTFGCDRIIKEQGIDGATLAELGSLKDLDDFGFPIKLAKKKVL